MARICPFPIDLSKSLDDLGLTDGFPFSRPEELARAFDYSFTGTKAAFYIARLADAEALADRDGLHVFEFCYRVADSPEICFYGFSVAADDRGLRDRFTAFLVMAS